MSVVATSPGIFGDARRTINWLVLGLAYWGAYSGRYNLPVANESLAVAYGWSKAEVGGIISAGLLVYGVSAFLNGFLVDRLGGRRGMLIGLSGSLVCNAAFGLACTSMPADRSTLLLALTALWALNGYFQSFCAVSLNRVNVAWFRATERGRFAATFSVFLQVGKALAFGLGVAVIAAGPWQGVFFLPAIIIAVLIVLTWRVVRDAPSGATPQPRPERDETVFASFRTIASHPMTKAIVCAELATGVLRHGFEQWFPRYLTEHLGLDVQSALFQRGSVIIVGASILGSVAGGVASDLFFDARRAPVACIAFVLQAAGLVVLMLSKEPVVVAVCLFIHSAALGTIHSMLTGAASMDVGGLRSTATAAGIFDGAQYVGGAVAGIGLGYLLDEYGWGMWSSSMLVCAGIGAVAVGAIWSNRTVIET